MNKTTAQPRQRQGYLAAPNTVLPWSSSLDQDEKFQKILRILLAALLVISLLVVFIPAKELSREEKEKLPPQLAKVILEKQKLPPKPKPKPKPKKIEPKKEKPEKKKEKKEKPKPKPIKAPAAKVKLAKKKAASSGLLQFQDDLMDMRDSIEPSRLANNNITRGQSKAKTLERSLITNKAKTGSGGINTGKLSRNTGGSALSGRQTTVVDATTNAQATAQANTQKKMRSGRSEEEIRRTMDRNKGAIFSIYNRALRRDPTLEGKVSIKMVIDASGSITKITLLSSELNNPALERKLLARIRLINFGEKAGGSTTLNYAFDFLPF